MSPSKSPSSRIIQASGRDLVQCVPRETDLAPAASAFLAVGADVDLLGVRLRAQRGPPLPGLECMAVPGPSPDRRGDTRGAAWRPLGHLGHHHAWRDEYGRAQGRIRAGWTLPFTRNPQYVGNVILFVGASLVANSLLLWITHALLSLVFVLAPILEERWLEEQYGAAYRAYRRATPRFWIRLPEDRHDRGLSDR